MLGDFKNWLMAPVSGLYLGLFRIAIGLASLITLFNLLIKDRLLGWYIYPEYHFPFIDMLALLDSGWVIYSLWGGMLILSVLLLIGVYSRVSSIFLWVGFFLFFNTDQIFYSDYIYFLLISLAWVCVLSCHHIFSISCRTSSDKGVPRWEVLCIRGQFVWSAGWILFYTFQYQFDGFSLSFLTLSEAIFPILYGVSWVLAIVAIGWMLFPRYRLYGVVCFIGLFALQHLLIVRGNHFEFFLLMIYALAWLPVQDLKRVLVPFSINLRADSYFQTSDALKKWVLIGVSLYFLIQIIIPLRHFFIPGNMFWTKEGGVYAWTMKLGDVQLVDGSFIIKDANRGFTWVLNAVEVSEAIKEFPNGNQLGKKMTSPAVVLEVAKLLEKRYQEEGVEDPEVYARIWVSRSSQSDRPAQMLIDPKVDLTNVHYNSFRHNKWINALE